MGVSKITGKLDSQQPYKGVAGLVVISLLLATAATAPAAKAQSYSYLPWALGSSLLYPLRYLGYSAFGGGYGNGGYGYGNSMFTSGSLLNMNRGYGGMGYNGYSAYGNPNFATVNSNAQGNTSTPANVLKYGALPPNINQNSPAGVNNPTNSGVNGSAANYSNSNYPVPNAPQYNGTQPLQPTASGFPAYNPGTAMPGQPYNAAGQPVAGQLLPGGNQANGKQHGKGKNHKNKNGQSQMQAQSQPYTAPPLAASQAATSTAPFAMAFINNVNTEYNGDIRKALANPSSRAWAESLGVSFKGDGKFAISDERSGIIERVLKDNSLDAVSKLNTVKILLGN